MHSRYPERLCRLAQGPRRFLGRAAREIDWTSPFDKVFDPDEGTIAAGLPAPPSTCVTNALDRHVEGVRATAGTGP